MHEATHQPHTNQMSPEMKQAVEAFEAIYAALDERLTRMEKRVAEMTEIFGDDDNTNTPTE